MRISDSTIEEIKAHIRIDEVLGDFISLRKKGGGHTLWACCPFPSHNERTPSFSVRSEHGFYKCFGCGEGGDTISFLKKVQGMSYLEAMEYLANKYNIAWEVAHSKAELNDEDKKREGLFLLMEEAQQYYENALAKSSTAQAYLQERSIAEELRAHFHLGYSPDAWEEFYHFATQKGHSEAMLEELGLIIKGKERPYDRFRGRLMFPLHDVVGRVVGFGARHLGETSAGAKYINSPETSIYHKKKFLYGLYQGKQAIRKEECCYLVEGYTDVLALHDLGLAHSVASAGTSLTEEQVRLLKRFTKKVVLLFDGDEAGLKAILRAGEVLLPEGLAVEVVLLPAGEDPASYAKKGSKGDFTTYLKNHAKDFFTFKTQHLLGKDNSPGHKIKVVHEVVRSIALMGDPIKRAVYVDFCSKLIDIKVEVIQEALAQVFDKKKRPKRRFDTTQPKEDKPISKKPPREESAVLSLLINYGNELLEEDSTLAKVVFEELEDVTLSYPLYKRIYDLLKQQWQEQQALSETALMEEGEDIQQAVIGLMVLSDGASQHADELLADKWHGEKRLNALIYRSIMRLKWKVVRRLAREERKKLAPLVHDDEIDEQLELCIAFKKVEMEIARSLSIVVGPSSS